MTVNTGQIDAGGNSDAGQGWQAVRSDTSIQYAPVEPPETPETPRWLQDIGRWLEEMFAPLGRMLGDAWPVLKWVLLALAIAALLYLLYQLIAPLIERREDSGAEEEDAWVPRREDALALLEDADRLAAEGRFDEATHLLLQRSVGHIAAARPNWIEPSSTAREIAALPALPDAARGAFSAISTRVERSLFALRKLDALDWQAAREAYSEFALANLSARALARNGGGTAVHAE
ncbi:hypothetical protein [Allopontixanthobacter sp.]|uniref:hypothetical protein n=1 Tax=Allopontixanthobacter sp. TaxID=2906452 RepID=UPI002ABBC0B5|nr:hypothetical protein [Allopontixanthobacter sp.]MDZ4307664.1 hypothetical protein [Allopontixanthobacter sp.]